MKKNVVGDTLLMLKDIPDYSNILIEQSCLVKTILNAGYVGVSWRKASAIETCEVFLYDEENPHYS